jgi:hypothetical protein
MSAPFASAAQWLCPMDCPGSCQERGGDFALFLFSEFKTKSASSVVPVICRWTSLQGFQTMSCGQLLHFGYKWFLGVCGQDLSVGVQGVISLVGHLPLPWALILVTRV